MRRRERQRRAAAPAPHQLRREQLPLLLGLGVLVQEAIERPDARLVLAQPDERAVASQHVGPRHRKRHAGLAGIAEDELAGLDRRSLAGQGIDAAALDGGLADRILVAQRVEVARLGAEVLRHQHGEAGKSLVLLSRQSPWSGATLDSESLKTLTPMWMSPLPNGASQCSGSLSP